MRRRARRGAGDRDPRRLRRGRVRSRHGGRSGHGGRGVAEGGFGGRELERGHLRRKLERGGHRGHGGRRTRRSRGRRGRRRGHREGRLLIDGREGRDGEVAVALGALHQLPGVLLGDREVGGAVRAVDVHGGSWFSSSLWTVSEVPPPEHGGADIPVCTEEGEQECLPPRRPAPRRR